MVQLSLRSIMLMCVYAATCGLVYVTPNLWVGWLVVFATALWMSSAIVGASQSRNRFTLGFAVTGCIWLIVWLGFAIQTPTSIEGNDIRQKIFRFMSFGQTPDYDPTLPVTTYAQVHDLYSSGRMGTQTTPRAPAWHNAMRLLVCLSALAVACVGGAFFQLLGGDNRTNETEKVDAPSSA